MAGLAAWMSFALLPAVVGGFAWPCVAPAPPLSGSPHGTARVRQSFFAWMSGFALLSAGFFVLANVGRLSTVPASALVGLLVGGCAAVGRRRGTLHEARNVLPSSAAFGLALAVSSSLFATLLPPVDASAAGSDASIYLGAAHQLARTGGLTHRDPLVAAMTVEEREALFRNRFEDDRTGPYARFPGGVPLASPKGDTVGFGFFHLFPVWLAVGLKTLGGDLYLRLMSLFALIGIASLFLVGRRLGGTALGLLACAVHAAFYPQAFFGRFPTSEMLAQALFLSGLASLVCGSGVERREAHLAGWLWGAACLCRVDALVFVALGLAALSLVPGRMGVRPRDWVVPAATTAVFASASVLAHLSTSARYLGALPGGRLLSAAVADRAWSGWTALVLVAAGALLARGAARPHGTRARAATRVALLAAAAATAAAFLHRLEPDRVARHVRWIAMYTTPAVLLLLCAGVALALFFGLRGAGRRGTSLALSLFSGPAALYVIDPMVIPLQPWAVRRFLPIVFPLLFLLALRGWQAGLRRACRRRTRLASALLAGLALAITGVFLASTARLAGRGQGGGVAAEIRALDQAIPPGALILVPDASADLHFQIPLEYAHGRDVLLLPLGEGEGEAVAAAARRFLARGIAGGRRVCLLLPRSTDLPGSLLRHFDVEPLFERSLSFESVRFVGPDAWPGPPVRLSLRSRVLDARLPALRPEAWRVRVGEPREDARLLVSGFHAPEVDVGPGRPGTPFRWTGPLARLALPPGGEVLLTIDVSRPAPAPPARVEIDVDGVPAPVAASGPGLWRLRVTFPPRAVPDGKRILSLRTNTFRMTGLGLSGDARDLGVRVLEARFEPRERPPSGSPEAQ